mgnify:FL=1
MTGRCGVIVAHGELGGGLLSALTRVAGPQDNLWALSNEGRAGPALMDDVESTLEERAAGREAFLFADLAGGSCGQACRRLLDQGTVRAVFHGVNLPMLIEFVFLQDRPLEELVDAVVSKSRRAVGVER